MSRSPFPGMDPYLEAPGIWPDVHNRLMNIFAEQLSEGIAPKYVAELNTQIVIDRLWDDADSRTVLPDVTIIQPRPTASSPMAVAIADPAPVQAAVPMAIPTRLVSVYVRLRENQQLVTVIELLSPINKRPGEGRREYLEKRATFLDSKVHLVEIDLLRRGPRMPFEGDLPHADYLIMVSRSDTRPTCEVWPLSLRQPLPTLHIPLLKPDPDVPLEMGQALQTAYRRARYDLRVNYQSDPTPPLTPADVEWAAEVVGE